MAWPMDALLQPFVDFAFMRRALVGIWVLSLGAAPLGVLLVYRRMSLMGDALAHSVLPGVAVGYFLAGLSVVAMTVGGLVAGLIVALLSGVSGRLSPGRDDSHLAAFYLTALALGVFLVSTGGSQVDLLHVLFGATLAMNDPALLLVATSTTLTTFAVTLLIRPLLLDTLEPSSIGIRSRWIALAHPILLILVVLNLVAGLHAMGTLMALALLILPAAATTYWCRFLETACVLAWLLATTAGTLGLLASFHFDWPTSPTIVLVLGGLFLVSLVFGYPKGLVYRLSFPTIKAKEA